MNKIGIIVNADDFGRHELINGAVREGCQNGLIRSATLMVMGNAFADAVKTCLLYTSGKAHWLSGPFPFGPGLESGTVSLQKTGL